MTERIGALVGTLAPDDVQRIPARVDSRDERSVASLGPLIEGELSKHVVGPNLILKLARPASPRMPLYDRRPYLIWS